MIRYEFCVGGKFGSLSAKDSVALSVVFSMEVSL